MKSSAPKIAVTLVGLLLAHGVHSQSLNYFAGQNAGNGNTGTVNTFVGANAGNGANAGSNNTFLGVWSGSSNTTGNDNTFIGVSAGALNSTGSGNTYTGASAGAYNLTSSNNSIYGYQAGGAGNMTGGGNSIFGAGAGSINSGEENSIFGVMAGYRNTSSYNTFIGAASGAGNSAGTNNTFLGRESGRSNTTGNQNTFLGVSAGQNNDTGYDNTYIGYNAGKNSAGGIGNSILGTGARILSGMSNSTAIGYKSYVRTSNSIVLGAIKGKDVKYGVNVGIGTSAPTYPLHVNGNAAKPGSSLWTVASDKNLKTNVRAFTDGLNTISNINPVWFEYNGKAEMPTGKTYVGVIAQDIQKVAPHTVGKFDYVNENGQTETYLDFDASALIFTLINAVKELNTITNKQNEVILQQSESIKKLQEQIVQTKGLSMAESSNASGAVLWQNAPNPSNGSTTIRYYVPEGSNNAQIRVVSISGKEVYSKQLTIAGESEIEISNQTILSGAYVYQLIVDGVVVDSKRMIVK